MKYTCLLKICVLVMSLTSLNAQQTTFAVIGDYGNGSIDESDVANLIKSWNPQFIITTGDNRYGNTNYDLTVGRDFCEYLAGAQSGTFCNGEGGVVNAFFPSTGNHDYADGGGINEYLAYFTLPGTDIRSSGTSGEELYYDFIMDHVHFFAIDSYSALTNETRAEQQTWLENQLKASEARWKIVYFHHAPYSSAANHGPTIEMQWPFAQWGADAVISGHDHTYERLEYDGITYFVNGLGGRSRYNFTTPLAGSVFQYNSDYGAQRVVADDTSMNISFINVNGDVIDEQLLLKTNNPPEFIAETIVGTTAKEDSSYLNSIAEYAIDPNGDSLVFSLLSGPAWLEISSKGLLTGMPGNDDVGLNSWILEVNDGRLGTDQATLQITVLSNSQDSVSSSTAFRRPKEYGKNTESLFIAYPIPTRDLIFVHLNRGEYRNTIITLYDITGSARCIKQAMGKDIEIDLTSFPPGLYFVNVRSDQMQETKEIVIHE